MKIMIEITLEGDTAKNITMKKLTLSVEGVDDSDIEDAVREVLRLLERGFTSGHNSDGTGCFSFETTESRSEGWMRATSASSLIPAGWGEWLWERISDNAPFTWGDNDHSLVTADRFLEHVTNSTVVPDHISPEVWEAFIDRLRGMGEAYIDLER